MDIIGSFRYAGTREYMKPKKRQKLCHNCEGEIDIDVIVCPFCAADLREEKPEQRYSSYVSQVQQMSQKQTNQSLYPAAATGPEVLPVKEPLKEEVVEAVMRDETVIPDETETRSGVFVPTILFTLGIQLCVFGLLMLLFSHKGVVILKWDARFWFIYLFASVPFLYFGYKALSKL
jgi:hypothetical protein